MIAVDDVSFLASRGVTALVGANGAGKTTLLKAIAGLRPLRTGSVEVTGGQARQRFGYLPQSPSPTPFLSARAYVEYFAYLAGVPKRQVSAAAAASLERVGMQERAKARKTSLSGGMFRRVALAAAIVAAPDVLLLDEPTAGLDPVQRAAFRALLTELSDDRVVLVSTHLLEDVAAIASQLIVLNGGVKVFGGTVDELIASSSAMSTAQPSLEAALLDVLGERTSRSTR